MCTNQLAVSCRDLLRRGYHTPFSTGKLRFAQVGGRDVYNITAPFAFEGRTFIAGRVEQRDTECAEMHFFGEAKDGWHPVADAPVFRDLQDPSVTFVDGELVLSGVRFPIALPGGENIWRMEFYRGKTWSSLTPFLAGPDKMKDIRLKQLSDGRIAVFTRPQGSKGGRGTIGLTIVERLEAITAEAIQKAPLFSNHFLPLEWGGANEVHTLKNGHLGVLGHIACFDTREHRHYYPMAFCVDPAIGTATAPHIIAQRKDFPPGPAKRPDLTDVIFSGGLHRNADGTATLYAGLSDAEAGWAVIPDPFAQDEQKK